MNISIISKVSSCSIIIIPTASLPFAPGNTNKYTVTVNQFSFFRIFIFCSFRISYKRKKTLYTLFFWMLFSTKLFLDSMLFLIKAALEYSMQFVNPFRYWWTYTLFPSFGNPDKISMNVCVLVLIQINSFDPFSLTLKHEMAVSYLTF